MRSFPNTIIFSPSDNNVSNISLDYLFKNPQPSYLRLDKSLDFKLFKY